MAVGTNLISGLSSGIDWKTMVDQLIAVDHRRVDLITNKKTETENKLKEWQSFNTKLLALKNAAESLNTPGKFQVFKADLTSSSSTVKASDLMSVTIGENATPASFNIKIINRAQAQKLSSNPFTGANVALGEDFAGQIVINGRVVTVNATDTLSDVATSINKLNTGTDATHVTATIVNYGTNDYRLILTSDNTGSKGISLLNGDSKNLVQLFGWKDNLTATVKNPITNGAQSEAFSSASVSIASLLGLSSAASGNVTIGDKTVNINLATMSLNDVKDAINQASPTGVTAAVVSQRENGILTFRLQINGTQTFSDSNNVLNTLGLLDHTSEDVSGLISGNSLTSRGSSLTSTTLIREIDGYLTYTAGDYITLSGTATDNTAVNSNFQITQATTVTDLLTEIKNRFGNVLAYVTADGKIRIDDLSNTGYLRVNLTSHLQDPYSTLQFVPGDGDFLTAAARKREVTAGEDALLELDGVEVVKSSNTISDLISGVSLNLLNADSTTTINLTINRDLDAIKGKIQDFVNKYNDVAAYINTQLSYDTKAEKPGGILFGDGTLSSVKSDLTSLLTQTIWGADSRFSILGLIGINLDNNGKLTINDSLLTAYLKSNINDIILLFTAQGVTSQSTLTYVTQSRDTKAGEYTVHISQAAARSTATAEVALSGTLGQGETMTITEGTKRADIALTAGMTLDDVINTINAELSTVYTQVLSAANTLKEGDNVTPISAQTTWNNIYGTNLENGDVINFSGTKRNNTAVTGSYTISNTSTDTIQGLLSAIEDAFANEIAVTVDTSGRLIVTDKTSGTSNLSLTITPPPGKGLDFGTILTTNPGGQTGRFALDITASKDATDHLVLTHNSYGSNYSFTIAESADLFWTSGDQTVNNGKDVAGTIGGESATGNGQMLGGNTGNVNTSGLYLKYTGTDENADVGTIKVTVGTAELFSRVLFKITDAFEGYATFKQQSLQNTIDDYEKKISQMENQLQQKREMMINRFVLMEMALNKIKNQSEWLANQLSIAEKAWRL